MASDTFSRMLQYLEVLEKYNIKEQVVIMKDICHLSLMLEFLPKLWIRKRVVDERKDKVSNNLKFIKQTDKDISKDQIQETLIIEEKGPIRRNKTRKIQCYNCRKRGHVMKNCPYTPRFMKRKNQKGDLNILLTLVTNYVLESKTRTSVLNTEYSNNKEQRVEKIKRYHKKSKLHMHKTMCIICTMENLMQRFGDAIFYDNILFIVFQKQFETFSFISDHS